MKVEYKFVTGEKGSIEIYGEFAEIMIELENEFKNYNRKETRRHESLSLFDKDPKNKDKSASIYRKVMRSLNKEKLRTAIAKLKPSEQELLRKIYLDKHTVSQDEYAKELGIPATTLRKRVERVRGKLKKLLK